MIKYFDRYTGTSSNVYTALEEVAGKKYSREELKEIAMLNGFETYDGSVADNLSMLWMLEDGVLLRPTKRPTEVEKSAKSKAPAKK